MLFSHTIVRSICICSVAPSLITRNSAGMFGQSVSSLTTAQSPYNNVTLWRYDSTFFNSGRIHLSDSLYDKPNPYTERSVVLNRKVCWSQTLVAYWIIKDLRSFGLLRSVDWLLVTNVSEQPIGPIVKGQAVQEEFQEQLGVQLYRELCGWWLFLRWEG
jgi:hypothetical protein